MADWPLIGRSEELDLLVEVVGGPGERPGAVVVAGAVGVGKSRLVADFLGHIARKGGRTAVVRATRSTATIPFGPFASWAPERVGTGAHGRLQVLRAISRALLGAGRGDRVVVAVDDAHLLDDGSAALVLHLVMNTPARVVVTLRSSEPCPDAVTALWKEGLAERIDLQPLSEPETVELLEDVLGGRVDPAARRRLWSLTQGAPLYLREVVRAGIAQGVLTCEHDDDGDGGTWRWRGSLAGSDRLRALMGGHVERAGSNERRLLELVAFGEPLPVPIVDQLVADGALARAEQAGYVTVDDDPSRPGTTTVRFAHPLYGEVLRAGVPNLTAREHHRALATAAVATGWQDREPLRVASWWLDSTATDVDPGVLVAAADRATELAEWELADRLGCAAEAAGAGGRATLSRAAALLPLGRWDDAEGLLTDLAQRALDPDIASEAARLHASLLFWRRGQVAAALDVDRRAAERLPTPARARVLAHGGLVALFACDPAEALRLATDAVAAAGPAMALRTQALAVATMSWTLQGHTTTARRVAELALPYLPVALEADVYRGASVAEVVAVMPAAYCLALAMDGRIDDAAAFADSLLGLAQGEARLFRGLISILVGRIALLQGRPDLAAHHGGEALANLREAGAHPPSQWAAAVLASGAAQLGDTATADEAVAWATSCGPPVPLYALELGVARAWVAAARGELSAARALAAESATRAAAAGMWAHELTCLLDLARLGGADIATTRLTELAGVVEGTYAAIGVAYVHALAAGDGHALDDASARFEAAGATLLAAEAGGHAAAAHRAAGRRGSHLTSLARARDMAARCGGAATPALRDLDAEPLLGTLTDREREVVEMAARGLTNREIGARLFVSIRTVNTHLYRAYTKLGINDRAQLAAVLPEVRGVHD